jgi:PadR family transcriptional regulator PadR
MWMGGRDMNEKPIRLSHQTLKVLKLFLSNPHRQLAGADLAREADGGSGTLYPILARLEQVGWLTSEWENIDPAEAGRPRKRLYLLTGDGYRKSQSALDDLRIPDGRIAWNLS